MLVLFVFYLIKYPDPLTFPSPLYPPLLTFAEHLPSAMRYK
ncbi:hypothetical protein DFP78_102449 [Photobacterium lutimaris]|nr:hypothetical protein DFP78_102449 [Photobacterium lutimaris]